jgi:hypothetical protein
MAQASFSDDATGVVKAIQESVAVEIFDENGVTTTSRPVFIYPTPKHNALEFSSLTALVDYLNFGVDKKESIFIVVDTPERVYLYSQVSEFEPRTAWAIVKSEYTEFRFNSYHAQEDFIINLQTKFTETRGDVEHDRNELQSLRETASGTRDLNEKEVADDGITQHLIVAAGLKFKTEPVINPVSLRPFRTFPEADQPLSPFVFRVRKENEILKMALFECDGGAWKNEARKNIAKFLRENLKHPIPVLA